MGSLDFRLIAVVLVVLLVTALVSIAGAWLTHAWQGMFAGPALAALVLPSLGLSDVASRHLNVTSLVSRRARRHVKPKRSD